MARKCKWCGENYDPAKESSIWCPKNPHRGRGAERRKPRIFTMIMLSGPGYLKSKMPLGRRL